MSQRRSPTSIQPRVATQTESSARPIRENIVQLVKRVNIATLAPKVVVGSVSIRDHIAARGRRAGPSRGSADLPDMPPNGGRAVDACGNSCADTGVRWISPGRACAPPYR